MAVNNIPVDEYSGGKYGFQSAYGNLRIEPYQNYITGETLYQTSVQLPMDGKMYQWKSVNTSARNIEDAIKIGKEQIAARYIKKYKIQ